MNGSHSQPFTINVEKVLPLSNAVSRNEVVRLKNRIKNVLLNKSLLIDLKDFKNIIVWTKLEKRFY